MIPVNETKGLVVRVVPAPPPPPGTIEDFREQVRDILRGRMRPSIAYAYNGCLDETTKALLRIVTGGWALTSNDLARNRIADARKALDLLEAALA